MRELVLRNAGMNPRTLECLPPLPRLPVHKRKTSFNKYVFYRRHLVCSCLRFQRYRKIFGWKANSLSSLGNLANARCLLAKRVSTATVAFAAVVYTFLGGALASAQEKGSDGFYHCSGKHLELVTDLPPGEELKRLPEVFDLAIPIWCEAFDVAEDAVADWKAIAYVMLDRGRFKSAGLIPPQVPEFPYGFQYGNLLFVSEQPSAYYRRHLVLHEGTHWFMSRHFKGNANPWIMEGMAEYIGTHSWDPSAAHLSLSVLPQDKNEFPYWGRITRIQEDIDGGIAPSLETILQYDNTAHRRVEAYAWSWAAVTFMKEHPRTHEAFQEMLAQPHRPDDSQSRWLVKRLGKDWSRVREEWNSFVTDLDYGYRTSSGMLAISAQPKVLRDRASVKVSANRSWQASGIVVSGGMKVRITASDNLFVVRPGSMPWKSGAGGVTLEYFNGRPLGQLVMQQVAPRPPKPVGATERLEILTVGQELIWAAKETGELHFRVNESTGELVDNAGELDVEIELIR